MINNNSKAPYYFRVSMILVGFAVFITMLYVAKEIILPLIYALLIAVLLNPFVNYLQRKRINRVIAIIITELATLIALGILIYFILSQVSQFTAELPQLKTKFDDLVNMVVTWASSTFHVSTTQVQNYLNESKNDALDNTGTMVSKTLL